MRNSLQLPLYVLAMSLQLAVVGYLFFWTEEKSAPDAGIDQFFALDLTNATSDNAAFAMAGLSAPENVADSYSWAVEQYERSKLKAQNETIEEALNNTGRRRSANEGELEFKGGYMILTCWTEHMWGNLYAPGPYRGTACEEASTRQLIASNETLLNRYRAAMQYSRYIDLPGIHGLTPILSIRAQELEITSIILLSRTAPDAAVKAWIANIQFYHRALADHPTLVGRSILMVNYRMAQLALPLLLEANDTVTMNHMNELLAVLGPFSAADLHIENSAKMEYLLISPVLEQLGDHSINKTYHFFEQYIENWNAPPSELDARWEAFVAKHRTTFLKAEDWHSPMQGMTTNMILGGVSISGDLAKAAVQADLRSRMLNLYVQARALGLGHDEIAELVANAPASLRNPFTGEAFGYSTDHGLLYYNYVFEGKPALQGMYLYDPQKTAEP